MLQLVLGRAGTGKSHYIMNKISKSRSEKAILIVPEQYSFVTERSVYENTKSVSKIDVKVVTFTKLVREFQKKYGTTKVNPASEITKLVIMRLACKQVSEQLCHFGKSCDSTAFYTDMLNLYDELNNAGISPDLLMNVKGESISDSLNVKLIDITLILTAFEVLMSKSGYTCVLPLKNINKKLCGTDFFKDTDVYVDEFSAFTEIQLDTLEKIMSCANSLTVTLTCDGIGAESDNLFLITQKTAKKLITIANKNSVPVSQPIIMNEQLRFKNSDLKYLEKNALRYSYETANSYYGALRCIAASNPYSEIMFTGAEIARLVTEEGFRYRDIVVISRNLTDYETYIRDIFEMYGIPYYHDDKEDISSNIFVIFLTELFEILIYGLTPQSAIKYMKNPLSGYSDDDAQLMDSYFFTWNIRNISFNAPFVLNPDGFSSEMSESDKEKLDRLNALREDLYIFSHTLETELKNKSAKKMTEILFTALSERGTMNALSTYVTEICRYTDFDKAHFDRIIKETVRLLNEIGDSAGDTEMTISDYYSLFECAQSTLKLGNIPDTLDQITVGITNRIRPHYPKIVFLLGAVAGEFPKESVTQGILSMNARQALCDSGLELDNNIENICASERLSSYLALCCASERVYVSYPKFSDTGTEKRPCQMIVSLLDAFPSEILTKTAELDKIFYIRNDKSAFYIYSSSSTSFSHETAALLKDKLLNSEQKYRVIRLDSSKKNIDAPIDDPCLTEKLFENDITLSSTRINQYSSCRFSYFCKYILRVTPKKRADFTRLKTGDMTHFILEHVFRSYDIRSLCKMQSAELDGIIEGSIENYMKTMLGDARLLGNRMNFLFRRLKSTLKKLFLRLSDEFVQSMYEPASFETWIKKGSKIEPRILSLPNGKKVCVEGKVDRVDTLKSGDKTFIRIIDYKTGSKKFSLDNVMSGIDIQMLLYLFSVCDKGQKLYGENLTPAGILYMPAGAPKISDTGNEEANKKGQTEFFTMNGLLLNDEKSLSAMERELGGVFIPYNKNKPDADSCLASAENIGLIKKKCDRIVTQIAEEMTQGRIDIEPILTKQKNSPCSYCDYHSVCLHSDTGCFREILSYPVSQVYDILKKEASENGQGMD